MAAPANATKLYTPRLLSLAAQLADFPLAGSFDHTAQTRSRTCGSLLEIGASCDESGRISSLGMQVTACAVGQASAAVMAKETIGRPAREFSDMLAAFEAWLKGEGTAPDWPGVDALELALPHTGRHGALLLPWKAMVEALSSPASTR